MEVFTHKKRFILNYDIMIVFSLSINYGIITGIDWNCFSVKNVAHGSLVCRHNRSMFGLISSVVFDRFIFNVDYFQKSFNTIKTSYIANTNADYSMKLGYQYEIKATCMIHVYAMIINI